MQRVSELITPLSPESGEQMPNTSEKTLAVASSTAAPQAARPETIAKLWQRMAMIYGHKWTSAYGDKDDGTWSSGLSGITGRQIAAGLRACVDSGEPWPPTLPEFRALCLGRSAGPNEHGLDYVPQHLRPQPLRDRSRLLSSDERDAKRQKFAEQ